MGSKSASTSLNNRKVNKLKQRRATRRNHKAVMKIDRKITSSTRPVSGKSKKRMKKEEKRARSNARYEQEKLVRSGLITEEDIKLLKQQEEEAEQQDESQVMEE